MPTRRRASVGIAWVAAAAAACGLDLVGAPVTPAPDPNASALDGGAPSPEDAAPAVVDAAPADAGDERLPDAPVEADAEPAGYVTLTASPVATPPATSDLTEEGTLDWAHWGAGGGQVRRKASGGGIIGDYVKTATGGNVIDYTFDGWPTATSWSDGPAGDETATNTKSHRYFVYAPDVMLAFALPASTTERRAILFFGGYRSRARLEVALDDAPAASASDERENEGYYHATRYEVVYRGKSAATKLLVRWRMVKVYEATATIILSSIALR